MTSLPAGPDWPGVGGTSGSGQAPPGLRRFLERPPQVRAGERCELCGEFIPDEHGHLVDLRNRNIRCACRACYLLFTHEGAVHGSFKAIPTRYLYDASFAITPLQWDALQIPVKMAFFFANTDQERVVAFYPSPAGATESLLSLDTWAEVMVANPGVGDIQPDVEAMLLRRTDDVTEAYLVPIDVCCELIGRVKLYWKGFSGGEEVWNDLDAFFAGIRAKSKPVVSGGDRG